MKILTSIAVLLLTACVCLGQTTKNNYYTTNANPTVSLTTSNFLLGVFERKGVALTNNETRTVALFGGISVQSGVFIHEVENVPAIFGSGFSIGDTVFGADEDGNYSGLTFTGNGSGLTGIVPATGSGTTLSNSLFGAHLVDGLAAETNVFGNSFTAGRFTNRTGIVLGPSPTASTVLSNDVNGGIFTTTLGNPTNITVNGVRGPGSSVVNAQFMSDGSMTFGGSLVIPNGNRYQSGTRGYLDFAGDGYLRLLNNANGGPNNFIMGSGSGASNGIGGLKIVNTIGGYTNLAVKKLVLPNVTNPSAGSATLVNGTITVNNTEVTAQTKVKATFQTVGGTTAGILIYTVIPGTSFTITSVSATGTTVATDISVVDYLLVENP